MGSASSNNNYIYDINPNYNTEYIDGRYGEKGFVYKGKNKLSDGPFDHRFIFIENFQSTFCVYF